MNETKATYEELEKKVAELSFENQELKKSLQEKERAITARSEKEELLSKVANSVESVIFLLKVEDNGEFRFVFINDHFFKDTGFNKANFIGKPVHTVVPPDSYEKEHKRYLEAIKRKRTVYWEETSPYEEGIKTGLVAMKPLFRGEICTHVLGIISDISLRVNAEIALKKNAKKLQELNQTKDKLLSIISHDLKSPFTSILNFTELLKKRLVEGNSDKAMEYAEVMSGAVNSTLELLTNLLDWSRSQTGKIEFIPEYFSMDNLIEEIIQLMEYGALNKEISIVKDVEIDLVVFADMNMVNTILRNLVSNAIKYTSHNGQITITASRKNEELCVSVKDNGVGIPPECIEHLFELQGFYSTNGTDQERGTGLGLIICKEFVEQHKGKIEVKSELGKGSEFWFSFSEKEITN